MKRKVKNIIKSIEAQSACWTNYVKSSGNECAYTDSVIENIIKSAVELAQLTGNENLLESRKENHLLEFLKKEVVYRFDIMGNDFELSDKDMEDIAQSLYDYDTEYIFNHDMIDNLLIEKAEAIFMSRTNSQIRTIRRVCKELKMDDIQVKFDKSVGCIVATDNQNNQEWLDMEIYEFLINECLGWNADGSLQEGFGYETKAIKKLTEDAEKYGVKKELAEK